MHVRADMVEMHVWQAVEAVLRNPELVAAEVAHQQTPIDARRAELHREMAMVEEALA